jgi:hypothetical protein
MQVIKERYTLAGTTCVDLTEGREKEALSSL